MGYIVRDGKVTKARRISSLTPDIRKKFFQQTDKQKEIKEKILERKKSLLKQSA